MQNYLKFKEYIKDNLIGREYIKDKSIDVDIDGQWYSLDDIDCLLDDLEFYEGL